MLEAAFEGRGIGEFSETTHCGGGGGGRGACDIMNVVWGDDLRRGDNGGESSQGAFRSVHSAFNSPFLYQQDFKYFLLLKRDSSFFLTDYA
jgi:hypothetical protein